MRTPKESAEEAGKSRDGLGHIPSEMMTGSLFCHRCGVTHTCDCWVCKSFEASLEHSKQLGDSSALFFRNNHLFPCWRELCACTVFLVTFFSSSLSMNVKEVWDPTLQSVSQCKIRNLPLKLHAKFVSTRTISLEQQACEDSVVSVKHVSKPS